MYERNDRKLKSENFLLTYFPEAGILNLEVIKESVFEYGVLVGGLQWSHN